MADVLRVPVHFDERHLIDRTLMLSLIGCINIEEQRNMEIDDDDVDDGQPFLWPFHNTFIFNLQFIIQQNISQVFMFDD